MFNYGVKIIKKIDICKYFSNFNKNLTFKEIIKVLYRKIWRIKKKVVYSRYGYITL